MKNNMSVELVMNVDFCYGCNTKGQPISYFYQVYIIFQPCLMSTSLFLPLIGEE